jgi:hypothetical protein
VPACPVPVDQRPINEYQELKTSWFFGWSTLPLRAYLLRLCCIWLVSGFLVTPVAAVSFPMQDAPLLFGLSTAISAGIIPGLILLRLYLGWNYVQNRLLQQQVIYEETGWYDGGSWEKPPAEVNQDRLIGTYQVAPTLIRLRWSLIGLVGFSLLNLLLLLAL